MRVIALCMYRSFLGKIRRISASRHRWGCDQHDKTSKKIALTRWPPGCSRQRQPMQRDSPTSPSFHAECNSSRITRRSVSSIVFCCFAQGGVIRVWYPRPPACYFRSRRSAFRIEMPWVVDDQSAGRQMLRQRVSRMRHEARAPKLAVPASRSRPAWKSSGV